jgi:hypothetical protein
MAVNWPSIAQGTGTGTTYTAPSPGSNIWTWSGYAWGSTGTTAKGGFAGPWVIFDNYGKARSFSDLPSAITVASSGETIHLFQNITEYPTIDKYITINKNLNFNFNGYTYTINGGYLRSDGTIGYNFSYIITNDSNEVYVRMTNGKIYLTNSGPSTTLIKEINTIPYVNKGCDWNLSSTKFSKDSGNFGVGSFISTVTGGIFEDTSLNSLYSSVELKPASSPNLKRVIFKDIVGISSYSKGIIFNGGENNFTVLAINCKGYSNALDITGIEVQSSYTGTNVTNRFRLIGCEGINNYSEVDTEGIGYGITSIGRVTLIKSTGLSLIGGGIKSDYSTLIHCTGQGTSSIVGLFSSSIVGAFYSIGGSNLRKCISSTESSIGLRTDGIIKYGVTGENIEGCSFHSRYGIYGPTGGSGNYINIHNCNIISFESAINYSSILSYKANIANCNLSPDERYTTNPILNDFFPITSDGTGSYIVNNVISGKNPADIYAINADLITSKSMYITNNTFTDFAGIISPVSNISQGMTSVSDNQNNIQQNI